MTTASLVGKEARVVELEVVESLSRPSRFNVIVRFAGGSDRESWIELDLETREAAIALAERAAKLYADRQGGGEIPVSVAPAAPQPETFLDKVPDGELDKALQSHLSRLMPTVSWKALVAKAKTAKNLLFLAILAAIACFAFGFSFTMPKGIEIPLIGGLLEGKTLDEQTVALWLPAVTIILQVFATARVAKTNLKNEALRQLLLELVLARGRTMEQLGTALENHMHLGENDWLARSSAKAYQGDADAKVAAATQANGGFDVITFMRRDFERRFRNLVSLDTQPNYRPYLLSFDPLRYLTIVNRLQWTLQEMSLRKGRGFQGFIVVDPVSFNILQAHRVGRIFLSVLYAVPLVWSLVVLKDAPTVVWVFNLVASAIVILLPLLWFYAALERRGGFPMRERFAAAFLDPPRVIKPSIP